MPTIRRHLAWLTLILVTLALSACMNRLLEPVANQGPTPSTTFDNGTTTITSAAPLTGSAATTAPVEAAATPIVTVDAAGTTPNATMQATGAATSVMSLTSSAEVARNLAQTDGYDNPISPVDVIASYYNAVELAEYERAYGYWDSAPLPYADFAAGYADTVGVQVIVQPTTRMEGAAGSIYAEVPTFLIAQHTDGSVLSFAGCITTRKSNVPAPDVPDPNWYLNAAEFAVVDNFANIPAALASGCSQ